MGLKHCSEREKEVRKDTPSSHRGTPTSQKKRVDENVSAGDKHCVQKKKKRVEQRREKGKRIVHAAKKIDAYSKRLWHEIGVKEKVPQGTLVRIKPGGTGGIKQKAKEL